MKIVYYTSGVTGSGRLVRGISIGNALHRKGISAEYIIVSSCPFAHLADLAGFKHIEIPAEHIDKLTKDLYPESIVYKTLAEINPDILIIELLWFPLYNFIDDLKCKKIFLYREMIEEFFSISTPEIEISFNPEHYDKMLSIEPGRTHFPMKQINPIIIRNRDEILTRKEALDKLNLDDSRKNCLFAFNGEPGEFDRVKKDYSYLEDEGYAMVYSTNYRGGLFPAVDYFNAFDLIICGAGYNAFWEAVFFNKEAIFVPVPRRFENQARRIADCQEYYFQKNGADQLAEIIMNI